MELPLRRLFFSGDSGYGERFADICQRYGPFDWVTLDSVQYGSRWAHLHMNPEQAVQAANDLGAHAFMPVHVGRFTLVPITGTSRSVVWSRPARAEMTHCGHQ